MRRILARSFVVALLALVAGSTGALAGARSAPPSKVDSQPAEGEELHQAPDTVSITFDQPLDPDSQIAVDNHCGTRIDDRHTRVTGNSMEVDLGADFAGTYHVTYFAKGVGGVTGQQTGTFTFVVHSGPSCDGERHRHREKKHPKKHRERHKGRDHERKDHDDHEDSSDTHEDDEHEGNDHSSSDDHSSAAGHGDDRHAGNKHGNGHGANHGNDKGGNRESNGITDMAGGPSGPPLRGPDLPAVAMSLGLCVVMGVLGGAVLRISSPK